MAEGVHYRAVWFPAVCRRFIEVSVEFLLYLVLGGFAGTLAGLFGVGGGGLAWAVNSRYGHGNSVVGCGIFNAR